MPELVFTRQAKRDLAGLPEALRDAVEQTLLAIASDPRAAGKPLLGRLSGRWSARVGSYRVLYTIERSAAAPQVVVRTIRHRAVAYREAREGQ